MDKERVFQIIMIILVLGGFLLIVYINDGQMDLVKKNLKTTKGRVYETKAYKGGTYFDVVFVVKGKGYTTGKADYERIYEGDKYKNKYLDVAYDSLNPEHNELLIKRDDYSKYNLEFQYPFFEVKPIPVHQDSL